MNTVILVLVSLFALILVLGIVLVVIRRNDRRDETLGNKRVPLYAELVQLSGTGRGQRYLLRKPEILIGSDPTSDIVLTEAGVSPAHASIHLESGQYILQDRTSQNGVWANGRRILAASLQLGSQFQIGLTIFALVRPDEALPAAGKHLVSLSQPSKTNSEPTPPQGSTAMASQGFERLDKIGAGGQVTVYRARLKGTNEIVAVKYLINAPQDDNRGYFFHKFKQQIIIGTAIRHPRCVRILGGNPRNDPPYLVEEFVQGGTLRDRMLKGRLSYDECVRILGEICDALYYLHQKGLVHRDIKPSNILLDMTGHVKLTDFGLIRIAGSPRLTQVGMCLGTPHYMSVEQARGDSTHIAAQSDLYSLGVVAYEMFTGTLPFDGTPDTILTHHLKDKPRPPKEVMPSLPEAVSRTILKAMEKDPAKRFRDAREMATALGYKQPFSPGESAQDARASGAPLRLQNTATLHIILITRTPTVLTRDLINTKDKLISREHGRMFLRDGYWCVAEQTDKSTPNGLYVNGVRVDEEGDVVQAGDEIRLGHTTLRVMA